jgi:voltage-gated potassium channel
MIIFSSISVLHVEDQPNCNIKTAEDALWWSYCTITTVGFGDRYPITTEGRFVAILLMTTGVGLFGTFTGYIASLFISDNLEEENSEDIIIDPKND